MSESDRVYLPGCASALTLSICTFFLAFGGRLCFAGAMGFRTGVSVISLPQAKIVITEREFIYHRHSMASCLSKTTYCLIDGERALGNAGNERPTTEVTSIVAIVGRKKYSLDSRGMFDAWGFGNNENAHSKDRRFGATCYDENNCVFRGVFGDGAGTFAVQWEVEDGKVARTVFTDDSDIVDLFISHIDPPGNVYD